MPVTVYTRHHGRVEFESAANWYTDEAGRLHLRTSNKEHIAVFSRAEWSYATDRPRKTEAH